MRVVVVDALTYAGNLGSIQDALEAAGERAAFVKGDIGDMGLMQHTLEAHAIDTVIHLAAESHVDRSIMGPAEFIKTNVVGTLTLLQACREAWGDRRDVRFHHVSTDEVYGTLGKTGRFTERTPYDPSSPYSASKAASDHLVRAWHRTYGLPVTVSNCSNNYGPYQFPEKLIPLMILNCLEGKELPVYGDGSNVRDWLYVGDHCRAVWEIVQRGRCGETYNVGGGCERSNLSIVRDICQHVAQSVEQPESKLLGLIRFVKDRPGHDWRYAVDYGKLARELGWQPRETLESGLKRTVDWYLNHRSWVGSVRSGEYRNWLQRNYGNRGRASAVENDNE